MYKDLTLEDCLQFKREHPDLTRMQVYRHKSIANAMKRLGVFDELYPYLKKRSCDITKEECEQFKREHPDINRTFLTNHYRSYRDAMIRLGVIDELYPTINNYPDRLTLEQCEQFKREHPDLDREQVRIHHKAYHKAMKRLGVYDTLYPLKHQKYSDEYLIERARHYKNQRDMLNSEPKILRAIVRRGKTFKGVALKHMEHLGDRKHKLIYAYEFADHSAYVGLTYDRERRKSDHLYDEESAVYRHREQTGLEPVYRQLTELLPVEEAQRMEGEWEERYRQQGWTILNVAPTGGIGGSRPAVVDRQKVVALFLQGVPVKCIPERVGASYNYVQHILTKAGVSYRGMSSVPIEVLDDDGRVIETFPSAKAAGEAWGMHPGNIRKNMQSNWRTRGHYLRYNAEAYRVRLGKEPPVYENKKATRL